MTKSIWHLYYLLTASLWRHVCNDISIDDISVTISHCRTYLTCIRILPTIRRSIIRKMTTSYSSNPCCWPWPHLSYFLLSPTFSNDWITSSILRMSLELKVVISKEYILYSFRCSASAIVLNWRLVICFLTTMWLVRKRRILLLRIATGTAAVHAVMDLYWWLTANDVSMTTDI